jgi:large subunit ribosomal protein L18
MSLKVTNARRKQRVRNSLRRSANGRPRLSVFRSSKHIYAQVIDDLKGETLASASSLEKTMREAAIRAPTSMRPRPSASCWRNAP